MQQKDFQVLLYYPQAYRCSKQKIARLSLHTTFEELLKTIKATFEIDTNSMMLSYHTYNQVFRSLTRLNFQDYKQTMQINKLIKIQTYDPLEKDLAYQKNSSTIQPTNISKKPQPEGLGAYKMNNYSICSFFADDIHLLEPFLAGMGDWKDKVKHSPANSNINQSSPRSH